jgi:magnesium transporter
LAWNNTVIGRKRPRTPGVASLDAHFELPRHLVESVSDALRAGDTGQVHDIVAPLHFSQIADLIERLEPEHRRQLVIAERDHLPPQFLNELDRSLRREVVKAIGRKRFAKALAELDTGDAVDLIEDVKRKKRQEVLDLILAPQRAPIVAALAYPRDSAGRLMHPEVVAIPTAWSVGATIDYLRDSDDLPNEFYAIFVVDAQNRPIGALPLDRVMRAKRPVVVDDIMEVEHLKPIPAKIDQEHVGHLFQDLDLVSAPVVDDDGRLVGTIMVDDIIDVIEEEAEEDFLHLAGVSDSDVFLPAIATARQRLRWLVVTLINTIIASLVISQFEATIQQVVALAVLMPIVAAMGGNAGMQVVTVTVRALATKEITAGNTLRVVWKEVRVGFINGIVFALIMGTLAALWFGAALLGCVLAAAMMLNMLWSGIAGTLIPLVVHRLGGDPAIAAGPFLTTTTDVLGFFLFLGLATVVLI